MVILVNKPAISGQVQCHIGTIGLEIHENPRSIGIGDIATVAPYIEFTGGIHHDPYGVVTGGEGPFFNGKRNFGRLPEVEEKVCTRIIDLLSSDFDDCSVGIGCRDHPDPIFPGFPAFALIGQPGHKNCLSANGDIVYLRFGKCNTGFVAGLRAWFMRTACGAKFQPEGWYPVCFIFEDIDTEEVADVVIRQDISHRSGVGCIISLIGSGTPPEFRGETQLAVEPCT